MANGVPTDKPPEQVHEIRHEPRWSLWSVV
jgi:hypothetical protein